MVQSGKFLFAIFALERFSVGGIKLVFQTPVFSVEKLVQLFLVPLVHVHVAPQMGFLRKFRLAQLATVRRIPHDGLEVSLDIKKSSEVLLAVMTFVQVPFCV